MSEIPEQVAAYVAEYAAAVQTLGRLQAAYDKLAGPYREAVAAPPRVGSHYIAPPAVDFSKDELRRIEA